jgi:hypothetical protein
MLKYAYLFRKLNTFSSMHIKVRTANIEVRVDTNTKIIDSRYVSPPESIWRIYRFPMNSQTHAVIRLSVHLQDDPYMTFHPSRLAEALHRTENRDTTLTAWFKLNQADSTAYSVLCATFLIFGYSSGWSL